MKKQMACGYWSSPIEEAFLAQGSRRLSGLQTFAEYVYWLESEPLQGSRVLCRASTHSPENIEQLTPDNFSVKNKNHEFGGGEYLLTEETIYFSNNADGHWYKMPHRAAEANEAQQITPNASYEQRFTAGDIWKNYLYLIRESHLDDHEVRNDIIKINLDSPNDWEVVESGYDFYCNFTVNKNVNQLAFLAWNHPNMPWDSCDLLTAQFSESGQITALEKSFGKQNVSLYQPTFGPDGKLYVVSDESGFWNLYRFTDEKMTPLLPMEAEFGLPFWVFACNTYCFIDNHTLVATAYENARHKLIKLDVNSLEYSILKTDYVDYGPYLSHIGSELFFYASTHCAPAAVTALNLKSGQSTVIRSESTIDLQAEDVSIAESICVENSSGQCVYAFYYPPAHATCVPLDGEKPPLIVMSHGGPTGMTSAGFNLKVQYWTSRGFAVVDVNYSGSTGFGKAYTQRLIGNWGKADIADCVAVVDYLSDCERIDGQRVFARGSSAGGYTTLGLLVYTERFSAGASYYGVGDLYSLAQSTHKFEKYYGDTLVGALPEAQHLYESRSPVLNLDKLNCPLLVLQGGQDKVVTPDQSEQLIEALKEKNITYQYRFYPEEGHGFRKKENIIDSLKTELAFYQSNLS